MPDVQDNKEKPQRKLTSREEAMNAVVASRHADFEKETGIKIEDSAPAVIDPDADPEAAEAEAERARLAAAAETGDDSEQQRLQQEQQAAAAEAAQSAAAAAEEATQRAQASAGIDPKGKYTFKVNGRETELSGDEILRRVQKDVSADVRLEEAGRVLRDAQALQQSLQQQQAEAAEAAKTGGAPEGVAVDPAVAKKFTDALFKGDSETATQAFNEAVSSAVAAARKDTTGRDKATPVDPNAIAAQVRQQIAIDSALERSRQDYPDLYADPDIEAVAATKIVRLVEGGKPFVSALDEVQADMAKKFGWKKAVPTGTPKPVATDRRAEKLERKESLEQTPSGPNVKSTTNEEPQPSVSDVIREIAKTRGQSL